MSQSKTWPKTWPKAWLRAALFGATLLFTLASVSGCASGYEGTLKKWTQEKEAFVNFEARAFARATLKTEAFRRAYVDEYARLFLLKDDKKAEILAKELSEDKDFWTVIVAFYTPEPPHNDLNPRRGIWEVRLENEATESAAPLRVTRLDKRNPTFQTLYGKVQAYEVLYELRFPKRLPNGKALLQPSPEKDRSLKLVIAGALAQMELLWPFPKDAPSP